MKRFNFLSTSLKMRQKLLGKYYFQAITQLSQCLGKYILMAKIVNKLQLGRLKLADRVLKILKL